MDVPKSPVSGLPLPSGSDVPTPLPVVEEQLRVDKKVVETGRVRVSKTVQEYTETLDLPLLHEEYEVQRIPVNQFVEVPPEALRKEGDAFVIPVLKEVLVTETRLLLVEEIRLTRRQVETRYTETVPLRREEVRIERQRDSSDEEPRPTT